MVTYATLVTILLVLALSILALVWMELSEVRARLDEARADANMLRVMAQSYYKESRALSEKCVVAKNVTLGQAGNEHPYCLDSSILGDPSCQDRYPVDSTNPGTNLEKWCSGCKSQWAKNRQSEEASPETLASL
jgi:hypothetical protein